jgi:hypothetical protein
MTKRVNIELIRKDPSKADWKKICRRKGLSEDFMREFQNYYVGAQFLYIRFYLKNLCKNLEIN